MSTEPTQITDSTVLPDLQQLVAERMRVLAEGDAITAAIDAALKKTVTEAVANQLGRYSDAGKAIEEGVKAALAVNFRDLNLPTYGATVLTIVRRIVESHTDSALNQAIQNQLAELLKPAPAVLKMSKLIEDFRKFGRENRMKASHESFTFQIEEVRYGSRWVHFDTDERKGRYDCAFRFLLSEDGTVSALSLRNAKVENTLFAASGLSWFERDLFSFTASGTKIELDIEQDDINLGYDTENEED